MYGRVSTILDFLDLIQEGNIGLINAIDSFDVRLGIKLSTYASLKIKTAIVKAYGNFGETIRIPLWLYQKYNQYKSFKSNYYQQYAEEPDESLIKASVELSDKQLHQLIKIENNVINLISLDSVVISGKSDTEATELSNLVASKNDSYSNLLNTMDDIALLKILRENLSKQEYDVLNYRYISDNKSQKEIGQILGVTNKRVSQIEKKALEKTKRYLEIPKKL